MMNEFFDKVYVVTCENFRERHDYIKKHFAARRVDFEFVISLDKSCFQDTPTLSSSERSAVYGHSYCLRQARLSGYERILICEDDVAFVEDLDARLEQFIGVIPDDWHYLQLGNQFWASDWIKRDKLADNLYRFRWGTGCHCVAVRNSIFDLSIARFNLFDHAADLIYYNLFYKLNCYCPEEFLADALSSNAHLSYSDNKHIFESRIHHARVLTPTSVEESVRSQSNS